MHMYLLGMLNEDRLLNVLNNWYMINNSSSLDMQQRSVFVHGTDVTVAAAAAFSLCFGFISGAAPPDTNSVADIT